MLMRLPRSMARSRSRKAQFNERIPAAHLGQLEGLRLEIPCGDQVIGLTLTNASTHIRFSLRTADPVEAVMRKAQAGAYLEAIFTARSQSAPVLLNHRQCVAIAGELYRAWARDPDTITPALSVSVWRNERGEIEREVIREPLSPEALKAALEGATRQLRAEHESDGDAALERNLGPLADKLLARKGIGSLTVETRRMLLRECFKGLLDGMKAQAAKAGGDYRPDTMAERFPAWNVPVRETQPARSKGAKLSAVLERWKVEAKPAPSTLETYKRAVRMLTERLGHEDTARITKQDIIAFKDVRMAAGLNAKTVNDGDLAALRSVFGWAVANDLMETNPAHGVKASVAKTQKLRSKSLSREEAALILHAAQSVRKGREYAERWAARRWAPWLMAYTGARVGEILQLRKQDVLQVNGLWCLRITPEAGTVKTGEARTIPLHEHLLEMGFPAFAQSAANEHLFLWRVRKGIASVKVAKQHLQRFAREALGIEPKSGLQPNHAWRHTFKTIGREAEIDSEILDAIEGHTPKSVGGRYGEITPKAMAKALERFPRFTLT
jgi:site-specific recombinase XerD